MYQVVLPAAVRCDMVLHRAFLVIHVRNNSIGGEVRHGVTSGFNRNHNHNHTINNNNNNNMIIIIISSSFI